MEQDLITRSVRLPAHVAEAVDKLAAADRRSFSNYVQVLLENHIADKPDTAKPERQPETA